MTKFTSIVLAGVAVLSLGLQASADSLDRTGSLLLYPLFDNSRSGIFTISVTNTNSDTNPGPVIGTTTLLAGTVDVEFVYIDGSSCLEFNRTRRLTPNDTLTVITRLDNPNQTLGYVYVFAKSPVTGKAINFDFLAGDSFMSAPDILGGLDIAPVVFKAGSGAAATGSITDVDGDNVRDLNGIEYEKVSDELLVPRFISDASQISRPELILIGLTGSSFTTIINFLVYNDNEEVFSAQYAFDCWDRVRLRDINGVFTDSFLDSTGNNLLEELTIPSFTLPAPAPVVAPKVETGWFRMDGAVAFSTAASVQDPAFMAVRIERILVGAVAGASLPYGIGEQANGDLVPHGPFPDLN